MAPAAKQFILISFQFQDFHSLEKKTFTNGLTYLKLTSVRNYDYHINKYKSEKSEGIVDLSKRFHVSFCFADKLKAISTTDNGLFISSATLLQFELK